MDISALNRRKEQIAFEMIEASREEHRELMIELEEIDRELESCTDFNPEDTQEEVENE